MAIRVSGRAGRSSHGSRPPSSACSVSRRMPSAFARTASANGRPPALQKASMTARSTNDTPKAASSGERRESSRGTCSSWTRRHRAKTDSCAPPRSAIEHALSITPTISRASSLYDVSGFFVNHFGARLSAATPVSRLPSTSTVTNSTAWTSSFISAMPKRNGIRASTSAPRRRQSSSRTLMPGQGPRARPRSPQSRQ